MEVLPLFLTFNFSLPPFRHACPAKPDELPKKPLGQERPVFLTPLQPDSPLEVKVHLEPHCDPKADTQHSSDGSSSETPEQPKSSSTPPPPPLPPPSPDPVVVHDSPPPPPVPPPSSAAHLQQPPPLPPKAQKLAVEDALERMSVGPNVEPQEPRSRQDGPQVEQLHPSDWPPPYEPSACDAPALPAEEEILNLPDLPPPPPLYQSEQISQIPQIPPTSASPDSPSLRSYAPTRAPPKPCLRPTTAAKPCPSPSLSPSRRPPPPPQKPTKFPVSLYVPVAAGDRRPSNTSQYDNLSEADEDDHFLERLLAATPEEAPLAPPAADLQAYDPVLYPLPPPPVLIPPSPSLSPSPLPPSLAALPSLPQEPQLEADSGWLKDAVVPPPPPSFADRLSPFQCGGPAPSEAHRAPSPSYSRPFSRGPRDRSAFPAPLLYTGSPPGHPRPAGHSAVGVPLVRSSPDFCRMPPGGQQLPKSVTF